MIRNFLLRALFALIAGAALGVIVGKLSDYFHLSLSFDHIVIGIVIFIVLTDRLLISRILVRQTHH